MDEQAIFLKAIEYEDREEQSAFLDRACGADENLRCHLEELLAVSDRADSFLEKPVAPNAGARDRSDPLEKCGTNIGPYLLLELIAEGGMGAVYRADQQAPLRRQVALKIIKPGMDTKQVIARFEAERQALALMDHPHIAQVLDAGSTKTGRPYFVMEFVQGAPITDYCNQHRLRLKERLELFVQVCRAIQHAHTKGIIHRDIKPTNILVAVKDGTAVPKVIDFGIAKATQQRLTEKTVFTSSHQLIGTPEYMSPEQVEMSGLDVDVRSDIYSLGVLLYELLVGTTPFDLKRLGDVGYSEICRIIREVEPPSPSRRLSTLGTATADTIEHRPIPAPTLRRMLQGELDWIVMKALEKERDRRYESASSFAADVENYLADEPVQACPPSTRYRMAKTYRKHRRLIQAATAFTVLLLVAIAVGLWAFAAEQKARLRAEAEFQRGLARCETLVKQAEELGAVGGGRLWGAASDAVTSAERLLDLAPDIGSEDRKQFESLRERVRRGTLNHRIIVELDGIRDQASYPVVDYGYLELFRDRVGADPFGDLSAAEVKETIRATGIAPRLALALDDWALVRRRISPSLSWRELAEIALDVDRAPWRVGMWDAIEEGSPQAIQTFVSSLNEDNAPTEFLCLLADSLMETDENLNTAESLLRKAVFSDPASYRANYFLGRLLCNGRPPRYSEGLYFLRMARALRPDDNDDALRLALRQTFQKTEDIDRALETVADGVKRFGSPSGIISAIAMLSDSEHEPSAEVLGLLRKSLLDRLSTSENSLLRELLGATLARGCRDGNTDDALQTALSEVELADRHDPFPLNMLARVQFAVGHHADAIHSLERAMALGDAPYRWREQLAKYREAVPGLVSYASIDDFLEEGNSIRSGDEWRYCKGTTPPNAGLEWTRLDFDDKTWATGVSPFGYGDEVHRTLLDDMAGSYTSLYIRREFEVAHLGDVERAVLSVMADDAFVAYLNGERIDDPRTNKDEVDNARAVHREFFHFWAVEPDAIDITQLLTSGRNVLAIQGNNRTLDDTAFWLAPSVRIEYIPDSEGTRQRVADCRKALGGDQQDLLAKYLEGRERQLGGDYGGAEGKFREVLALDRSRAEPFVRLHECLVELHGAAAAAKLLRDELAKGEHAPLDNLPPKKPGELKVKRDGSSFRLTASPFQHVDPNVSHLSTTWEIRDANVDSQSEFVLRMVSDSHLRSLALPSHRLRPNTTYRWRISYESSSGRSVASDEERFTTPDYTQYIVPFDLTEEFNRDVILNLGDPINQWVDGTGYALTEEGFFGTGIEHHARRGLPLDRSIGIHRLGDYHGNNVIQINRDTAQSIRIAVSPRRYLAVRFLVTGGWGDSELPIEFEYADGSREPKKLHCEDWLDTPERGAPNWGGKFGNEIVPILSDLSHVSIFDGSIREGASLFEVSLDANPRKKLQAIVLHAEQWMDSINGKEQFNLFAATGVSSEEESN